MGKLNSFTFITLNGYYKGSNEDISWHRHDGETARYASENSSSGSTLLFGRVTYEMMEHFWPTPQAYEMFPIVAKNMNKAEKIVFSRTLRKVMWNNSRLIKDNMINEIKKLKQSSENNMTLLGSGSILAQLSEYALIDEYQIMIDPVVINKGTSIFEGISRKLELALTNTKTFDNGVVLLCYKPA
jgi:dihydrofolate reductase